MPNSGAIGHGAVSRHLWLLLRESSSLLDSCIYLEVFLCRVQIYHLDPKCECWGLLGKEHDATTEIFWPKRILKKPHDSRAKGGGGGGEWKTSPCGLGPSPKPTLPLQSPSSLFLVCSAIKKKKKKNFPQPPSPCMLKPGSTLSPLLISAFRWWLDHHFLWQHQLAILQAVHTSRFLQTPRASWPLDLRHAWYLVPASHPGWPQWLEE